MWLFCRIDGMFDLPSCWRNLSTGIRFWLDSLLLTSNKHDEYRESFLHVSIRSYIAEADTRQWGASEV